MLSVKSLRSRLLTISISEENLTSSIALFQNWNAFGSPNLGMYTYTHMNLTYSSQSLLFYTGSSALVQGCLWLNAEDSLILSSTAEPLGSQLNFCSSSFPLSVQRWYFPLLPACCGQTVFSRVNHNISHPPFSSVVWPPPLPHQEWKLNSCPFGFGLAFGNYLQWIEWFYVLRFGLKKLCSLDCSLSRCSPSGCPLLDSRHQQEAQATWAGHLEMLCWQAQLSSAFGSSLPRSQTCKWRSLQMISALSCWNHP